MQVGAAGLEKTFDRFLRGAGSTRVYYAVDGKREPFPDIGTRVKGPEERFHPLVITSYSIHYTKLYEIAAIIAADPIIVDTARRLA